MDFAQAGIVIGLVMILTAMVKRTVPDMPEQLTPVVAFVLGCAAIFLAAETVWAHEAVIGGKTLEDLDFWSKVVGGLFLGTGGAGALHEGLKAIHNVGENKTDGPA